MPRVAPGQSDEKMAVSADPMARRQPLSGKTPLRRRQESNALLRRIESANATDAWEAAKTLDATRPPGSARRLARLVRRGRHAHTRHAAAWALGWIGCGEEFVSGPLLAAIEDVREPIELRGHAIEAIGMQMQHRPRPRAFLEVGRTLIEYLAHPSVELRFWSAWALGLMKFREALPALQQLAREDERVYPGWWRVADEARDAADAIASGAWPDRDHATYPASLG